MVFVLRRETLEQILSDLVTANVHLSNVPYMYEPKNNGRYIVYILTESLKVLAYLLHGEESFLRS